MRILSCVGVLSVVVCLTETSTLAQSVGQQPATQTAAQTAAPPSSAPQTTAPQTPSPQSLPQQVEPSAVQQAPVQQPQAQSAQQTQAERTAAQQMSAQTAVHYELGPMVLAVIVLLVLGYLFWIMIHYANRLAQTGPLGFQVKEALRTIRQQTIIKTLAEKWEAGKYFQEVMNDSVWLLSHPIPAVPDSLKDDTMVRSARNFLFETRRFGRTSEGPSPFYMGGLGGSESEKDQMRNSFLQDLRTWEAETMEPEARRRYEKELQSQFASVGNKETIEYFDFASVWGQGPEFVLQFTAVVTIIFAVIALGILQRLGEDQAGTILAAIAGYVLGQATARGRTAKAEQPEQPTIRAPEPVTMRAPEQSPAKGT
jgi:hypothetical protein